MLGELLYEQLLFLLQRQNDFLLGLSMRPLLLHEPILLLHLVNVATEHSLHLLYLVLYLFLHVFQVLERISLLHGVIILAEFSGFVLFNCLWEGGVDLPMEKLLLILVTTPTIGAVGSCLL